MKGNLLKFATLALVASTAALPSLASADDWRRHDEHHRDGGDGWKNLAIGSAAIGVLGLINHDRNVATLGAIGAIYAGSRYEHDHDGGRWVRDRDDWRRHDDWRRDRDRDDRRDARRDRDDRRDRRHDRD